MNKLVIILFFLIILVIGVVVYIIATKKGKEVVPEEEKILCPTLTEYFQNETIRIKLRDVFDNYFKQFKVMENMYKYPIFTSTTPLQTEGILLIAQPKIPYMQSNPLPTTCDNGTYDLSISFNLRVNNVITIYETVPLEYITLDVDATVNYNTITKTLNIVKDSIDAKYTIPSYQVIEDLYNTLEENKSKTRDFLAPIFPIII